MRCTGCIFTLVSCLAGVCVADLQLTVPPSFDLNKPMPVAWTRTSNDPFQFLLQTIKFPSVLSTSQELITVNASAETLKGTMSIITRFDGPHIIVAMDPVTKRLIATSNSFDAGQDSPASSSSNQQGSAQVPAAAIAGAVIGSIASLILAMLAVWYFLRRLRKKYGLTNRTPPVDGSGTNYRVASMEKVENWRSHRIPSPPPAPTIAGTAHTQRRRDSLSSVGRHPLSLTDVDIRTVDHPYDVESHTAPSSNGLMSMIASLRTAILNSEKRTTESIERLRVQNSAYDGDGERSTAPPPSYASSPTAAATVTAVPSLPSTVRQPKKV